MTDGWKAVEDFCLRVFGSNPDGSPRKISIEPYTYLVEFSDLTQSPATPQTSVLTVQANANFVLTAPRMISVVAASGVVQSPLIKILLTDTGSQQALMSEAIPVTTFFGQPQFAGPQNLLQYPRIIAGRSGLSVAVTNYSAILSSPVDYKRASFAFAGALVKDFS